MKNLLLLVVFINFLTLPTIMVGCGYDISVMMTQVSNEEESKSSTFNTMQEEEAKLHDTYSSLLAFDSKDTRKNQAYYDRENLVFKELYISVQTPPPDFIS